MKHRNKAFLQAKLGPEIEEIVFETDTEDWKEIREKKRDHVSKIVKLKTT